MTDMRSLIDIITEATGSRRKRVPTSVISPTPLRDGRSIFPEPEDEAWAPVGEPVMLPLADLDLHPDGLAIAQGTFFWAGNSRHENTKPISVAMHDGQYHVLDGYHRVIQASKDGKTEILAQVVK